MAWLPMYPLPSVAAPWVVRGRLAGCAWVACGRCAMLRLAVFCRVRTRIFLWLRGRRGPPTIHQTNSPAAVSVSPRPSRAVGVGEAAIGVGRFGRWKPVLWTCLAGGAQIGSLFLLPRFLLAQAVDERCVHGDPSPRRFLAGSSSPECPRPFGAGRHDEGEDAARGEDSVGSVHRDERPAPGVGRARLRPRPARPHRRDRASRAPTPAPPGAPRCSAGWA
jgi:hypothetical protein